MARMKKGVLGAVLGAVGTVTGHLNYGDNVITTRRKSSNSKNTVNCVSVKGQLRKFEEGLFYNLDVMRQYYGYIMPLNMINAHEVFTIVLSKYKKVAPGLYKTAGFKVFKPSTFVHLALRVSDDFKALFVNYCFDFRNDVSPLNCVVCCYIFNTQKNEFGFISGSMSDLSGVVEFGLEGNLFDDSFILNVFVYEKNTEKISKTYGMKVQKV